MMNNHFQYLTRDKQAHRGNGLAFFASIFDIGANTLEF